MKSTFTKGLILGGMLGVAAYTMMGPDISSRNRMKKRMWKKGRRLALTSGNVVRDVMDIFR